MCGRFALFATRQEILEHFNLEDGFSMKPRYNIVPSEMLPVVIGSKPKIDFFRWGFVPYWQKPLGDKVPAGHINARSETLTEKPTFKRAFAHQRCLIPASGYYEWKKIRDKKQPYFIYSEPHPIIAFAGIWSCWQTFSGEKLNTFAIVTTSAIDNVSQLHERMPLIIASDKYHDWLNEKAKFEEIKNINQFADLQNYSFHPVTIRMNSPSFDSQECIQRL